LYRNILVAVDLAHGEVVARIVAVARHLAGADGAITVLTVIEPVPAYVAAEIPETILEGNRAAARGRLEALAAGEGLEARAVLRHGAPAAEILDEAESMGADAIILGSHRPDYSDYLLGSTAARVVRHAGCTVVVERSTVSA
jgi:nucleotide-binding universal stress UspA family protein